MKKLMILGASILQLPAIQQAKKMGLHVRYESECYWI